MKLKAVSDIPAFGGMEFSTFKLKRGISGSELFEAVDKFASSNTANPALARMRVFETNHKNERTRPNNRVESDAVKRCTVSCYLGAGAAHAGRYRKRNPR